MIISIAGTILANDIQVQDKDLSDEKDFSSCRLLVTAEDASVFPDEGKQVSASADLYRQAVSQPEKAIYWKLTIEFGRMYEKMQREWREYCVRELEDLQRIKGSLEQNAAAGAAGQEE